MRLRKRRHIKKLSDQELVQHYATSQDAVLLGELYERYGHLVFGSCLKYLENEAEARDAVTGIFEKLMRELPRHEVTHFRSWLYMVSRNYCLMALRERTSHRKREQQYQASLGATDLAEYPQEEEVPRATAQQLEQALSTLKTEQRTCVELFYLKELCYREVAEKTGYSLKQVKSYIQNGKRNLRLKLQESHGPVVER